jgi:hypothetical protein
VSPEKYRNLEGDSGVTRYFIGPDFIAVQFQDPTVYIYDDNSPGSEYVEKMKELALGGRGLASYISRYVQKRFSRKLPAW